MAHMKGTFIIMHHRNCTSNMHEHILQYEINFERMYAVYRSQNCFKCRLATTDIEQ